MKDLIEQWANEYNRELGIQFAAKAECIPNARDAYRAGAERMAKEVAICWHRINLYESKANLNADEKKLYYESCTFLDELKVAMLGGE